jgi:PTH2 family peptidyl-tRNA hydrolase
MYKQVIILRKDLKMSLGKAIAQACHASLGSYERVDRKIIRKWNEYGAKKVVLKVNSRKKLLEIYEKAKKKKLPCFLVRDAGLTELRKGTITALAIGPAEEELIDKITGNIKLF